MKLPQSILRRPHRRGFSLTELLTVIAVVGILAGLLLPAFITARQSARMAPCISNLRQIGMALRMYMDDHNGGRPIGFQPVYDGGYFKSPAVLLCPDDPTGNWGGIYAREHYAGPRDEWNKDWPTSPPPETLHYSYVHPFTPDWPTWKWKLLMQLENDNPGIAACQLHGRKIDQMVGLPPDLLDYEGIVLRLRLDGSVVKRPVFWKAERDPDGGSTTTGDPDRFFSDTLTAAIDLQFMRQRQSQAAAHSQDTPRTNRASP
jgi:prepilin-type N-terminal cleavage/methylation domain-containing protein